MVIAKLTDYLNSTWLVVAVLVVGVILRFWVATFGSNFDFDSYKIVGDIVGSFGNVYTETTRYNYGPVWFTVLGAFWWVAAYFPDQELVYRVLIISLLTIADIGIALILRRRFGIIPFVVFFLNPISIVITGFHNQFDNIAIFIGLVACLIAPKPGAKTITRRHLYTVLLIGVSLTVKHLLFVLPFWLFLREKNPKLKLFMLLGPIGIFIISFAPFALAGGLQGILNNVFLYDSYANAPFLHTLVSPAVFEILNPTYIFISGLAIIGFFTMRLPMLESYMWYLLFLVILAPAVANQYLSIAVMPAAVLGFIFFVPFFALTTIFLVVVSRVGLSIGELVVYIPPQILTYLTQDSMRSEYRILIFFLFIGAIFAFLYRYHFGRVCNITRKIKESVTEQILPFMDGIK